MSIGTQTRVPGSARDISKGLPSTPGVRGPERSGGCLGRLRITVWALDEEPASDSMIGRRRPGIKGSLGSRLACDLLLSLAENGRDRESPLVGGVMGWRLATDIRAIGKSGRLLGTETGDAKHPCRVKDATVGYRAAWEEDRGWGSVVGSCMRAG